MKAISESDGLQKEWMRQAKKLTTPKELEKFVQKLTTKYNHDYSTICHACAAAAVAAAKVVNRSPQGGITGFQAGAVMWEFIKGWGLVQRGPMELIEYRNLLFPQYDDTMPQSISSQTHEWLQEEARKLIKESKPGSRAPHPDVMKRWKLFAEGHIPEWLAIKVRAGRGGAFRAALPQ